MVFADIIESAYTFVACAVPAFVFEHSMSVTARGVQ
jgi:hypothetical protein